MHDFHISLQTDNMTVTHDNITRMSASPSFYFLIAQCVSAGHICSDCCIVGKYKTGTTFDLIPLSCWRWFIICQENVFAVKGSLVISYFPASQMSWG